MKILNTTSKKIYTIIISKKNLDCNNKKQEQFGEPGNKKKPQAIKQNIDNKKTKGNYKCKYVFSMSCTHKIK